MGFDGFQLIQSARSAIFKIRSCAFSGTRMESQKVELKDREFVSATISGAGGANPPRRLVLVGYENREATHMFSLFSGSCIEPSWGIISK